MNNAIEVKMGFDNNYSYTACIIYQVNQSVTGKSWPG